MTIVRLSEVNMTAPNEISIKEALVKNSTFTKSHLKAKLLKYKLLENKCYECGIDPEWNGKILNLQVDHINGCNTDHRIENLRFLCPNCHSQTITFCGANAKNRIPGETFTCNQCGEYRNRRSKSGLCLKCKSTSDRVSWPDDDTLKQMIQESNINKTAKRLKVSFPALKKRLIKHNLISNI